MLTASQARDEVRSTGHIIGPAVIDEDVDLSQFRAQKGAMTSPILFSDVEFRGSVKGVPNRPLKFVGGSICSLQYPRGVPWRHAIEMIQVEIGAIHAAQSVHEGDFSCIRCRICSVTFERARFGGDATFTGTEFGERPDREICVIRTPTSCPFVTFSGATFVGAGRFDAATFHTRTNFHGAIFEKQARFPEVEADRSINFIGVRAKGRAEFRGCRLTGASFGQTEDAHSSDEVTEFGAQADFRRCVFTGNTIFDQTVFDGDALFLRAVVSGSGLSFRGAYASRTLDLTGIRFEHNRGGLTLDANAADSVRLDWDAVGPRVLRGEEILPVQDRARMLRALSRRLNSLGAPVQARVVGFEARREERTERETTCEGKSSGECLAKEAEWWLWTLPTRNGTDPSNAIVALALLWMLAALLAGTWGQIVVLPRAALRDAGPVYEAITADEVPRNARWPSGLARLRAAAGFASALVLKLGARRARLSAPKATFVLWTLWVISWGLLAGVAAVLAASFPGLRQLTAG